MKKAVITTSFLFMLCLGQLSAQHEAAPNALAFRWTWNNFQFPISQKFDRYNYTSGAELTYIRHLGKALNLAVPLKVGKAYLPLNADGDAGNADLIGSLDAVLQLKFTKPESKIYPYLLGGAGLMTETTNDWKMNPEFPVGLGLNVLVSPNLYISAETQYRFDLNDNRNQLQHALGIWITLGGGEIEKKPTDRDKDGITDNEDQCPDEPGTPATFGCPDSDGDGVADKNDQCPKEAGKPALGGCPDRDNDGVADHQDRCPDEPGKIELLGCPVTDRDGDGIADKDDKCPDAAGSKYTGGCPDQDGDGLADSDDKCPTIAGTPADKGCPDTDGDGLIDPEDRCPEVAGPASNKGCPELKKEEKEVLQFAMKAVQFETGSAKLLQSSYKVLDDIAQIMREHPEQKLRINGHTDSIGDAGENQALSEKRTKTCYDYLATQGVALNRMSHVGYGETKPIADNLYAPGREKNRRVEFEMYVD
ncbi:MAG: OmpA family protein [Saprospiraceae bacterium]|nr:OmpA family protein [Saprospiraceae bacterium]